MAKATEPMAHEHYVPEAFEDVKRGICPVCAHAVRWNAPTDEWVADTALIVLVLTENELIIADEAVATQYPEYHDTAEVFAEKVALCDLFEAFGGAHYTV